MFFGRSGPPASRSNAGCHYLFRAGRFGFGVFCWERKVIRAEKIADERVPLSARSGYISENRGTVREKSRRGRVYTPPFFGHGRGKVGVDQSAVSVSRCK